MFANVCNVGSGEFKAYHRTGIEAYLLVYEIKIEKIYYLTWGEIDKRLCGLVVRVSGYRSRSTGFDSRPYHIF
jgi:hypothetical protein